MTCLTWQRPAAAAAPIAGNPVQDVPSRRISRRRDVAEAQLFSFRMFENDAGRNQFLDYVRVQLDS